MTGPHGSDRRAAVPASVGAQCCGLVRAGHLPPRQDQLSAGRNWITCPCVRRLIGSQGWAAWHDMSLQFKTGARGNARCVAGVKPFSRPACSIAVFVCRWREICATSSTQRRTIDTRRYCAVSRRLPWAITTGPACLGPGWNGDVNRLPDDRELAQELTLDLMAAPGRTTSVGCSWRIGLVLLDLFESPGDGGHGSAIAERSRPKHSAVRSRSALKTTGA
jgi:hypothetical protein